MEFDTEKIDDMVLALLYLTSFKEYDAIRTWKGYDWDTMDRLHQKGMIGDPHSRKKSVGLSDEGAKRSKELFEQYFAKRS